MTTKKLIEVALPLDKINAEAEKEKQIRHGHPSNLHQYWARRPFTTARAVILASLIDDPSSHPEVYPTEDAQNKERMRLFNILEQLVSWENTDNEAVLNTAREEIRKNVGKEGGPTFLDPFSGGGAIPFEAQRLGLETYARDLNPLAVMINKAMVEFPFSFSNIVPINPKLNSMIRKLGWTGMSGMANDVRYYGTWMVKEAYKRIGSLYPKIKIPRNQGGGETNVISWIWARTVKCPNPACGCDAPLARTFALSTKRGAEFHVVPEYIKGKLSFSVEPGKVVKNDGTVTRTGATCLHCGQPISFDYIRAEGKANRIHYSLMAIAGEAKRGRIYCSPSIEHILAANVDEPKDVPETYLPKQALGFRVQAYGMDQHKKLYTNRQLLALSTFCSLVSDAQQLAEKDAIKAGMKNDHISIADGGTGARAYSQAICTHLAFLVDKMAPLHCNLTLWKPLAQCPLSFFGRQAVPMAWDFAEANPFSNSSGSVEVMLDGYVKALEASFKLSPVAPGHAEQWDAQSDYNINNVMISTDPPYYDNIGYADLSDIFYVWLRKSLKNIYPELFDTTLAPKGEELIATPFRHDNNTEKAKAFFEKGMLNACQKMYSAARDDIPVTIYYAYKQSSTEETDDGQATSSTGWETMLTAIINAGFSITGTWPVRTERAARNVGLGTNALASSIVLVCRKRPEDAPQTTRRNLIAELRRELRPALKKLQQSNIAPVDLAQAAIGPGMSVFSKYRRVLEADGTPMTVRSAQQIINEEVDMYFNEQVGSMDTASRFCVDLYVQCAYNDIKYGEAEVLANAKGTSIPMMASHGVLYAKGGIVHLVERKDLPEKVEHDESNIWMLTQQLTYAMEKGGVEACAQIVASMFGSNAESAKDLAYRLYTIADQKKWANEAYAYNALVVAWSDIQSKAAELKAVVPEQMTLFDFGMNNES